MVEVNLFHYHERPTFLHRMNPVAKIVVLLMFSTALTQISLVATIFLMLLLCIVALLVRVPIGRYQRELRFFIIMGTIIALARWANTGLWEEALHALLRFATIVCMGILFADTSAPDDIARSVGGLLARLPWIPGYRIGSTIELTISTIPLLFDAASQISYARRARSENRWKHPIKRIVSYVSAVFDLLLIRAEYLESALRARLYDADAPRQSFGFRFTDAALILVSLLFVFAIQMIN